MPGDLSADMRNALRHLLVGPAWIAADSVPIGTFRALQRRGLVEQIEGSSRCRLTDTGTPVAEQIRTEQRRLLHGRD